MASVAGEGCEYAAVRHLATKLFYATKGRRCRLGSPMSTVIRNGIQMVSRLPRYTHAARVYAPRARANLRRSGCCSHDATSDLCLHF